MRVLSFREALGGPWSGNLTGWLVLLIPSSLLVILQESATDFPGWGPIVVLALAEHLASGVVVGVVVLLARARWRIIPLGVLFPMWIAAGAARGVVWAILVTTVGNDSALIQYRIATWVAISVLWSPLFAYTLAQLDHRRHMIGALDAARRDLAADRARMELSARERKSELMAIVQRTISPVIREIHRSLNAVSPGADPSALTAMGERLSVVAYDAARLIAPEQALEEQSTRPSERAPLISALDFPQNRPLLTAGLTGLILVPLVVPDTLRVHGLVAALGTLGALAVLTVTLATTLAALRWVRSRSGKPPEWVFALAFLIPGLAGSLALFVVLQGIPSDRLVAVLVILPLGALFTGACLSAAVGLANSNQDLVDEVSRAVSDAIACRRTSASADQRARKQVAELLHGPVYGRLSACAMALNFNAAALDDADSPKGAEVTQTVLEYLSAASRDLDTLAST